MSVVKQILASMEHESCSQRRSLNKLVEQRAGVVEEKRNVADRKVRLSALYKDMCSETNVLQQHVEAATAELALLQQKNERDSNHLRFYLGLIESIDYIDVTDRRALRLHLHDAVELLGDSELLQSIYQALGNAEDDSDEEEDGDYALDNLDDAINGDGLDDPSGASSNSLFLWADEHPLCGPQQSSDQLYVAMDAREISQVQRLETDVEALKDRIESLLGNPFGAEVKDAEVQIDEKILLLHTLNNISGDGTTTSAGSSPGPGPVGGSSGNKRGGGGGKPQPGKSRCVGGLMY